MAYYMVFDTSDDGMIEQALSIRHGGGLPPGGVLSWRGDGPATLFDGYKQARAAINRSEHYRLAYGDGKIPEKQFCLIVGVRFAKNQPEGLRWNR